MRRYVKKLVEAAKKASYKLAALDERLKEKVLFRMAELLLKRKDFILEQNQKDIFKAKREGKEKGFLDRLSLNEKRLKEMALSLEEVAKLPFSLYATIKQWRRPNGLLVKKVRVPIGVVLIIYEARPNVTSDCVGLLFKSSNVGILRGGSLSLASNLAIANTLLEAVKENNIDFPPFFIVEKTAYRIVELLLKENNYIDLVIPRGGEALIRRVVEGSSIPVIKHYKGVCHIFVDEEVDIEEALKICINAKVQRPSVCNAVEKILVHKNIARDFLPLLKREFDKYSVEIRADAKTAKILKGVKRATEKDWHEEYLDLIVTLKVVEGLDEAIWHINFYGSRHTDSILTKNEANARRFLKEVDSACCFKNISTRFSDGYQLGLGAEIGISTDKLHARGPMGLEELTTYKWVVEGDGQIRE